MFVVGADIIFTCGTYMHDGPRNFIKKERFVTIKLS